MATLAEGEKTEDVEEPDQLLCPITHVMYRDPCFVPESGNTYERSAIEKYWASTSSARDPLTNTVLTIQTLHTNWGMRRQVQRFLDEHPSYLPQGWPHRDVPAATSLKRPKANSIWRRVLCTAAIACAALFLAGFWHHLANQEQIPLVSSDKNPRVQTLHPPTGSKLQALKDDYQLTIRLPPAPFNSDVLSEFCFALFWLAFIGVWTASAAMGGAPALFVLFSLPFWGVGVSIALHSCSNMFLDEVLMVNNITYSITWQAFNHSLWKRSGSIPDLQGLPVRLCDSSTCTISFDSGMSEHTFGDKLREIEAKWVQEQIQQHLLNVTNHVERFGGESSRRELTHQTGGFHHPHFHSFNSAHFSVVIR